MFFFVTVGPADHIPWPPWKEHLRMLEDIFITAARRTPIGAFQGALSAVSAAQLGSAVVRAVLEDSGVPAGRISEVLLGCVLQAGVGQGPARQAALGGGIPASVPTATINKLCGSGMKAIMMGFDQIRAGSSSVVLAGGLESMSNAPYLLLKARQGYRMGHDKVYDHMFHDALLSPYDDKLMGNFADATAEKYGFTREQQDAFAISSVSRALAASGAGAFAKEIIPVSVHDRKGVRVVDEDETPRTCDVSKIPTMRPAFARTGTVTAASSSSISDGAAAVVLMSGSALREQGSTPLARVLAHTSHAQEPEWFTTAPVGAIRSLLAQTGWSAGDVDLFEINEAFACVTMAAMRDLGLDHDKVNVNGGACALGHPVGATGARLVATLIHALAARGSKRGVAALCIGGGEATAIALELV
jgi:acetyl-CoA C-acetyltransferase